MNKFRFLEIIDQIKGILFFLFFLIIYFFCCTIIPQALNILINIGSVFFSPEKILIIKKIIHDDLVYKLIIVISFVLLFFYFKKYCVVFFNNEEWYISFGKALFPAIFSFTFGYIVVFIMIKSIEIYPLNNYVNELVKTQNYEYINILNKLKNAHYFKVIVLFFYIVIFVPVYEEVLFRGFLQGSFQKIFKKKNLDVYLVALIFGLSHLPSLSNVAFAFTIGIFLSKIVKRTGSINISIWVHSLINFTSLLSGLIFYYIEYNL